MNTNDNYGLEALFYMDKEANNSNWISNSYSVMRESDHEFYYMYYETGYWAYNYFGHGYN